MEQEIRWKLAMAARVLDFARAHPSADVSCNTLVSRLEDRVKRGDALALQQREGSEREHAAIARREELRWEIIRLQVKHLVRAAELAVPDHPELAGQFTLPPAGGSLKAFITAARSLLAAALAQKDLFLQLGVGDTFLDEFSQGVADFDASTQTANSGHGGHVGARADLEVVAGECVKLAGLLDGIYRARFRNDAESLAAWKSAKLVYTPARAKKLAVVAPTPEPAPGPGPAPAPVVADAGRGKRQDEGKDGKAA